MKYFTGAIAAITLLAILIFSIQNLEVINVSFLFWSMSVSKFAVFLVAYILGMISGWGLVGLIKQLFQD